MKRLMTIFVIFCCVSSFAQPGSAPTSPPAGYEIKVTIRPFKNQFVYLGHYFGKQYPIIDSVMLNAKGEAAFKGSASLPGGIYLVGYPNKTGFFEILIDKQQRFSLVADTATMLQGVQFFNSPDNVLFSSYQKYMMVKGADIANAKDQLKRATNATDSSHWTAELTKLDKTVKDYREDIIKKNPGNILSALLICMREPELPLAYQSPKTRTDSIESFNFYKKHYWDGVQFGDGRLAYTTLFEEKIDKFYSQLVAPQPDSVIKEIDWMLGFASINEEMTRFLLLKFVNRYLVQRYMWEDAIFVHLFEKFFAQKTYSWLNEKGRKTITDRAYNLMANIMGSPASEIELPDTAGKAKSLFAISAEYMIVCFWDPTCGHCKEVLPKLDSFYQAKWKAAGLKIFAVAKETDGTKKDWLDFIRAQRLQEWTNVYYSKADDKIRTDTGIPGYSQLYDVQTFPTLYLLDKDKPLRP